MIRLFLAILFLLLLAAPAFGDLTTPEKADIKRLTDSSKALRDAERYLIESIACCSTPEARTALADALEAFLVAQIDHWRTLAFLLHTGTENPTPLPVFTDDEWRTQAWFHLDRYLLQLDTIAAALTAAQTHHVSNATYQDNLMRARDIWLAAARTNAAAMNRALLYATPWPALLPGKTIPTVVGPHGDYRMMQWYVNRGKNYALDTYAALVAVYRAGLNGVVVRDAWTQSSAMLDELDRATALLADVTFTTEEAAEDRFCRALRVTKILTVSAATRYQGWGYVLAGPTSNPEIFRKLTDSWKQGVDLATWQAMLFPESTRCASPFLNN